MCQQYYVLDIPTVLEHVIQNLLRIECSVRTKHDTLCNLKLVLKSDRARDTIDKFLYDIRQNIHNVEQQLYIYLKMKCTHVNIDEMIDYAVFHIDFVRDNRRIRDSLLSKLLIYLTLSVTVGENKRRWNILNRLTLQLFQ